MCAADYPDNALESDALLPAAGWQGGGAPPVESA
jgi:hypothetical protein